MPIDDPVTVTVPLQATAYAIPAGHRVRLAVSDTYWPVGMAFPRRRSRCRSAAAQPAGCTCRAAIRDRLMPGCPRSASRRPARRCPARRRCCGPAGAGSSAIWRPARPRCSSTGHGSRVRIVETDTEMGEENNDDVSHRRGRSADGDRRLPGPRHPSTAPAQSIRTEARSTMTCDAARFTVTTTLEAFEGDARVHAANPHPPLPARRSLMTPHRSIHVCLRTADGALVLVLRSGAAEPGASANLPPLVAVRGPSRRAAGPRELLRVSRPGRCRS